MITIYQKTILDLIKVKNKIIEIKHNLENNQKLIITLDTETTGKYYNKFQIENTGIDIVDKIVEFGAIFSIQNVDYYGFETIVPIEDTIFNENPDLGFRIFVNPFIDNHKPFHITMPKEPFDIHGISLEFLEAKTIMECSNEILSESAPSLLNKYIIDNVESSYIKEIIEMINLCDILIAHNAPFDVGMINEAINDYNKLNEDKLNFISCEIIDTLKLFKNEFPKEKLISMQEENEPKEINHKLDYMMYLSGINERNVHGAYWDSKLLIDSYSVLLEKYFTKNFMKDIVEKQTKYLSTLKIDDFQSLKEQVNHLFYTYVNDLSYLDFDSIKNHLELQLPNINKQKRNEILKNQIDISIIYYKVFITLNNEVVDMETLKNKVEKMTTKKPNKVIDDIKKSKLFTKEEIQYLIDNQEQMSHYLTQAVFYYFENKFNNEIIEPLIKNEYNKILELTKENTILNIEKNKVYTYFRTDGSIATKDNSLTTIIGSISDLKTFFKKENYLGNDKVICMDFNSMVNYIRVEKYLKDVNDTLENKININYGITTLLKLELNNEIIDFEINIIAKNNQGIREIPQIIAKAYSDKTMNENSYQNPYLSLEQFVELNNNDNLFVTLGSYQGLMEKVLFTENIEDKFNLSKVGLIRSLLSILLANNTKLNFEFYPCDKFLHNFKYKFLSEYEDINYIFTDPKIYLENDLEYHMVRCYKYNENIYKLNNLNIFKNIEIKDELNTEFVSLDLEYCEKFPKDKVNIPGLIENLEFIKERRPNLYNELKELVDENGELYNLDDNSKENVAKIQKRYFTVKAYEFLEQRFIDNEIREEIKPFYRKRFDFELEVINNMNFDGYTLLVSDFLNVLSNYIGGLIGPGRGCLTKDALVYTYNDNKLSFKSIDNIIVGDKVITHNNLIKEVKETFVYDINEELVQIDTFYADQTNPIILTKDHKIYVGNNIWKQAKDISNDDYLYLPIPKYKTKKIQNFDLSKYNKFNAIVNDETITYTYSQNKNNEFCFKDLESKLNIDRRIVKKLFLSIQEDKEFKNSKKDILVNYILTKFDSLIDWYNYIDSLNKRIINRYLNNDYYFRKFIGRWIGDGSIRSDLNRACVNIVFNKNCIKDINETITFIENNKFDYTIKYIDNHCRIDINDKFLHLFINDIFKDYKFESNTKHFPKFVFNLNKNEIKDVIDGYISADGHIEEKYNRIKTSSVSYRLSLELKQLLLQIGLPCGIREVKESLISKIKLKKGNKYYVNTFPIFKIEKTKYEIENDFIKLKVRNIINIEKTNTKVYDFTVEDDHSYTTNNYIVHNSAAGSLVSWAYKITNVDPMLEYNKPEKHLLFERYLNPERVSLPDIDMDMNGLLNKDLLLNKIDVEGIDTTIQNFIDIIKSKYENDEFIAGKSLIEDYQIALYGSDKVAKIVTRDTYQAKSAIAAVCKYLGNDFAEDSGFKLKGENPYIDFSSRISGSAFTKPGIGFKDVFDVSSKFYNPYFVNLYYSNYHVKKVVDLARKLEGTIANYGVHAAGVLILDPKNNYLNNGYMVIGGVNVSLLDGKFVEDYINIKFDFLGLASLEEIEKSLYFIEKLRGKDFKDEIYRTINNEYVLYEDQYTFEKVFDNQNTKKIFQFSSDGMQDLVKRVEPKCFEDLVAITALYRPGPMESGMVDMYVKNKHEPDNVFYEFKELEEILSLTYGTCLSGDTLVTTKFGKNKTIKDIVDSNEINLEVLSLDEKTNKLEYKKVTKTFNNGFKNVFKITTKNGYYVEATEDHKFLTNRGWVELKDLSENDFLILPKKHLDNNEKTFNKDKLLILAYLLADGHLSKSAIAFINKDESLINNFKNSINNVFDNIKFSESIGIRDVKQILCTTKNRTTYNSNELINWIKELGLFFKKSHEKFIPNFVFDLCKEDILYFLAKYWECDGHISKNGCHIKTISKDICYSVQKLLLKVGINSSINASPYENKKKENQIAYAINISPFNFKEIAKHIDSKKGKVEINYANDNVLATIDKTFIINYIKNKLIENKISLRTFTKLSGVSSTIFSNTIKNKHPITINTLTKVNKILKDSFINSIINNDIYFTKIKEIKNLNKIIEVYDIEVEDNHNFFANNILVHNCVYQEQIMKIVQVLGGFSLGGADLVRRAMGKKNKEEMDNLKGKFIDGTIETYKGRHLNLNVLEKFAISQSLILYYDGENILLNSIKDMNELGLDEKFSDKDYGRLIVKKGCKVELDETYITKLLATFLFETIEKFAGYGFNKSHAYAYTNVSMQMAYLKAHFPLEFFASILFNNADDIEKLSEYIIDAKKNNIEIVGPNINLSSYQFDIIEDKIIYGLSNIKGISSKDIKKIIDERNQNGLFKDIGDFLQRFIINLNGSFKTLENLIYSGVLDSLSINKDTIKKFLYSYNLFTLPINEDKEIYLERLNNKKEFIKSLFILDSKYNEEENILNNCLNIFSLENNNLFPLLMEKLLKSKLSTSEKLFVKELDVSTMNAKDSKKYLKDMEKNVLNKEKYVNELKEHFNLIEDMNNYICYDLIDDSIERNRVVMLNLISIIENNSIDDKIIESLNKDIKKNKSIIYLSNSEYVNIGSVSNIGSILDKEYIFEDFKGVPKLNLMYEPFKIEGSYQYRSSIKDIISGVNDNDEAYMSLLILDINCMEHRLYLSQDQIFRYKNNLSIGDPIIFDVDITLNKDKYYKKLINILVLKEKNSVWESLDVFKLPLLSIKDLDKDKIRKKVSLKAEFCTLEEIKEDWIKSTKNWPGIEEGNKQVVLILVSYKQITTKDGREFQILEVSDGIGYETIELLYSKLNLQELEKGIRNPIVIELGKRVDNGYGISAAYKSNIVFLDETYVLSSKEERYEYSENVNELLDGKEHINVYTKGRTTLGRALSNFSEISTKVVHNNSLYEFKTLEGYWFFLKLFLLTNEEHFEFLNMNGFESKNHGSHLTKSLDKLNEEQEKEFREKIKLALYSKIFNNDNLINQMKENKLPYLHYYNYNGRIRVLPEFDWLVDIINNISKELHKVD